MRRLTVADFWKLVEKTRRCWLWHGTVGGQGYGYFKRLRAHRFSWTLKHGPIGKGLFVLHRCDNRLCVRPSHLYEGTAAENSADMVQRGRYVKGRVHRGAAHRKAKLTEKQVVEIRSGRERGLKMAELAKLFGVSPTLIGNIVRRTAWKHV